jgi:ABC-2 type transport system permease protein
VSLAQDLRIVRAVALKDLQSSLTERTFTILSVIMPINFLLLFLLFALTGGQAPTAVVLEEDGPYARELVTAMQNAHSFIIHETTAAEARAAIDRGEIVAIVTVPATFDADIQAGRVVELPVVVNNLNTDFTNDIRRAVPLAITSFYANAFPDKVVIQVREVDVQPHDTGYVPYLAVSIVVIGLMLGGLLQAGTNAAREYETGTIKELILSPASRWAIQTGKALGALVLNLGAGALVLVVVVVGLGIQPVHWGELVGFALLLIAIYVSLGTLFGTFLRRRQAVVPLSFGLTLPLFFISGPFGPVGWGSPVVAAVAHAFPVYYAIALFQHAFHGFQTTPTSTVTNALILAGFAVLAIGLSAFVLGRQNR